MCATWRSRHPQPINQKNVNKKPSQVNLNIDHFQSPVSPIRNDILAKLWFVIINIDNTRIYSIKLLDYLYQNVMIYIILVNYRYATSKHGEFLDLRDLNIRCASESIGSLKIANIQMQNSWYVQWSSFIPRHSYIILQLSPQHHTRQSIRPKPTNEAYAVAATS